MNKSGKNRNIKKKLGKNIRKFRKQKNFTQEELSLSLDLDNSYIGKVENAQLNITIDKIIAVADFLEIEVIDLFK